MSKQCAKSTNGPDWTDVEMAIRAIDGVHLGKTTVTISPEGIGSTGGLLIDLRTVWPVLDGSHELREVVSSSRYPCKDCSSLEAHLLGGIYRHDFSIGEAYQQRFLPQ